MRVDEPDIDLHGWLRAFYSCKALGRSFVMDNGVQRPLPAYADFSYNRSNYAAVLREVLQPLNLRLAQGKYIDAVVAMPQREASFASSGYQFSAPAVLAGIGKSDSLAVEVGSLPPVSSDASPAPAPSGPRRLRARASGLLKSSARRLGFEYNELVFSASKASMDRHSGGSNPSMNKVNHLWNVSALASDSLGSLDFARVVDFSAHDTARVVFGGEIRRADSELNYENGTAITQYSSVFDGLTVSLSGDRWSFLWRRDGNILEVPGILGSCASGSSRVSFAGVRGVPFLDKIPGLRWLFSYESRYSDELLVAVCLMEAGDD